MLIINNEIQIQEGNEIYERDYFTRGCKRVCIQIEIPKQDNVTYDTLVNTFSDGASIIRQLKETRLETREVKQETTTSDTSDDTATEETTLQAEETTANSTEETTTENNEETDVADTTEEIKEEPEVTYEDVEVEYIKDYPLTDFVVAGDIIDKRDGTFTVYIGKKTESEILEEQNAELMLTLVGGEI